MKLMRRSCERALLRRKHLAIVLLLFSCLFSLWLITGGVVDQSRLELVHTKPLQLQQARLEQKFGNSLQSTDEVVKNHSVIIEDVDRLPLTFSYCEVVNVAIVVAGYNASRDVVTLIKSILHYRRTPLHFHFISDHTATHILSTLFNTWQLPSVNVSYYPLGQYTERVAMIENIHYSGVYGLMKLILTEALPSTLLQVIVLDADVTLATDIAQLWMLLSTMKDKNKLLGLVENQSDWYLGTLWKKYKPWPAIGRGFNTGVMLMDLEQLRVNNWHQMWKEVALKEKQVTSLADQDIINAVIKYHPQLHYIIPCYWNIQLSEHTHSEDCYHSSSQVKIIHWNSPLKTNVEVKHVQYFRHFYNIFTEMDGSHLRAQPLFCNHGDTIFINYTQVNKEEHCWQFRQQQTYRTHLYFIDYHYQQPAGHPDVTLVAQLSSDRLHMLEALAEHWDGPMSLALFLTDSEAQYFLHFILSSPVISRRKNIGFHVVYNSHFAAELYPVNYLRNTALTNVNTDYVFLTDIDFLPNYGICDYLRSLLVDHEDDSSHKNAFVVPAFETLRYRLDFPIDKANLLRMLDEGLLHTFRYHVWRRGHAATDYKQWRTASKPYMVEWSPDYEPYIVVRSDVTQYNTQFVGFGWNKVSHIMKLDAMGYKFHVLPDVFIIHMPHSPSLDIIKFRSSPHYRDCLQQIKEEFQRSLVKQFGADAFKYLVA